MLLRGLWRDPAAEFSVRLVRSRYTAALRVSSPASDAVPLPPALLQESMRVLPVSADGTAVQTQTDIKLGDYALPAG